MGIVHFLNVKEGDCHLIEHPSERTTVIDVCNAFTQRPSHQVEAVPVTARSLGITGNFNQKTHPENPIEYLQARNIVSIFRFILSHPDMDHMDGIRDFFDTFSPANFWDTNNTKKLNDFCTVYSEVDWNFYKSLRDGVEPSYLTRLVLYSGARGKFYNETESGTGGGDGLHVLSPTKRLLRKGNVEENWNDACYVILYITSKGRKILFPGDAHDDTWAYLLDNYDSISDVDVLVAPHHGRGSDADFTFLDTLKPKLTLFGNASSKHLAYDKWNARGLKYITNNQAGSVVLDPDGDDFEVYVTCEAFARAYSESVNGPCFYSERLKAWYLMGI